MYDTQAFKPLYLPTVPNEQVGSLFSSVTVAATDAAVASARFPGSTPSGSVQVQIANLSTSWAYVNFGVFGAVVAATVANSYPVGPGAVVVVSVAPEVTGASVILGTAAATGNVILTRGEGL